MDKKQLLLSRLNSIGETLSTIPSSMALIGLGSCGLEIDRMDDYSDLDFFVVVRDGSRETFLSDLSWLEKQSKLVYQFKNTNDGFKALYEDGVFVEFAVFEPDDLKRIPYSPGRIVWAQEDFDTALAEPQISLPESKNIDQDWAVNEALCLLYIGMSRFLRGEKLSAFRFVQVYALDRVIELAHTWEQERKIESDPFVLDRRFELRFPQISGSLPGLMQGYEATPQSVLKLLEFLEAFYPVNAGLAAEIRTLTNRAI